MIVLTVFLNALCISFHFSCNLTCEFGQFGVNCAQTCPCHDKNCNPVSGACNLCKKPFLSLFGIIKLSFLKLCYVICYGDTKEPMRF